MLYLKEPGINDKEDVFNFQRESRRYTEEFSLEGIDNFKNLIIYDYWLEELKKYKCIEDERDDYSNQITYVLVDENNYVYGACNIREHLKGNLINHGGNVGYFVRPSKRGEGYGTELLKLCLLKCKELGLDKVLITARVENETSNRLIKKCGGVYENDFTDLNTNISYHRYWFYL